MRWLIASRIIHNSFVALIVARDQSEFLMRLPWKLTEVFLHEGYVVGEARCQEYLNEYPNSIHLKFTVASLLQMYWLMSNERSEELIKTKMYHSLALFQQVVESREPKYTPLALFSVANIQMILENYEESEKTLKELPQSPINPMALYPTLYLKQGKTKEAIILCSRMLMQHVNQTYLTLTTLANISKTEQNYDKAFFYLEAIYKMQNLFGTGLHSAAYNYCQLHIENGKKEEAAKWFQTYVDGLLSSGYDYQGNPYFENYDLEVNPTGQKIIRKKMIESLIDDDSLKVLAGIPEYEKAIKELKNAIADM
ncbi:tetratricopeptide repeat protein [Sporolactobacillus pectinivorans]|uniref:tetratricopeptide repeat protein n=1 Tax=Sporolactobacillus pectinivorans TaxID=1591408 RepID=UPI00138FADEB|nr:XRE family transcriptional regulator [Sporolactobacillus pectinivorans]